MRTLLPRLVVFGLFPFLFSCVQPEKPLQVGINCSETSKPVEQRICAMPALLAQESQMNTMWANLTKVKTPAKWLVAEQNQWRYSTNKNCVPSKIAALDLAREQSRADECIARSYRGRISELSSLISIKDPQQDTCATVLEKFRQASWTKAPADKRFQPMLAAPALTDNFIKVDQMRQLANSAAESRQLLTREYAASAALLKAVTGNMYIRTLEHQSIHALQSVQGSANCSRFTFFETNSGKQSDLVEAPSIVRNGDETSFCSSTIGFLAEIQDAPAFVRETDVEMISHITITPRQDAEWLASCKFIVRFNPAFEVSEAHCNGIDCDELVPQAKEIAAEFFANPNVTPRVSRMLNDPESKRDVQLMRELAEKEQLASATRWDISIPTFGKMTMTSYATFEPDPAIFPIVLSGHTYLARISHGTFGWRQSPDYLLAVYSLAGNKLEAVAGLNIAMSRNEFADGYLQ